MNTLTVWGGNSDKHSIIANASDVSLSIDSHPQSVNKRNGGTATFTVVAKGDGLKYQWYYNNPNTTNGFVKSSNKTDTYSIKADAKSHDKGFQVYCVVTDSTGNSVQSDIATLTVGDPTPALMILNQPQSVMLPNGETANFTVSAQGEGLKYQWYYYNPDNSSDFKKSSNTTDTYSIKADATNQSKGFQVYCVVTDSSGNSITSDVATLTVAAPLTLTSPTSTIITTNQSAVFTVSTGSNISNYLWEYKLPNTSNWLAYEGNGSNTASITVAGADAVNGTQYRCTVTDTYGQTATSEPATLTVRTPITISDLPSMTVVEGNNATFSITATSDNLTYQWQTGVATDDDTPIAWTDISSATSSTYTFKTKYTDDGRLFRCLVTDPYETLNSSVATLTVTPAYTVISNTTKEISMNLGDACQLDATGTGLRYYSNSKALTVDKNGVVTANDVTTGYVFVLDKYGHKTYYKIHVVEAFEELAFDEPVISVLPGESIRLYTNKDAYQMVSD